MNLRQQIAAREDLPGALSRNRTGAEVDGGQRERYLLCSHAADQTKENTKRVWILLPECLVTQRQVGHGERLQRVDCRRLVVDALRPHIGSIQAQAVPL